ncbi:hypothetical protein F5X99DRAFT_262831 [Biscogniauxia marginata]|nr:hypothetical protein F5X99DRAFT_262831 [Biscogniauxia marginata]
MLSMNSYCFILPLVCVLCVLAVPLDPGVSLRRVQQLLPSCTEASAPTTFTLKDITYLRYEASQNPSEAPPNSTVLAFEVVNQANEVSTGCSCQNVMVDGHWADDSEYWYACLDRSITIDGQDFTVKTNAQISWDAWLLAVNQTWACDEQATVRQISTTTLAPTCSETTTGPQYVKECTAPDVEVAATSQQREDPYGFLILGPIWP